MRLGRFVMSILLVSSFEDDVPGFRRKNLKKELEAIDEDTARAEARARRIGMLPASPSLDRALDPVELDAGSSESELERAGESSAGNKGSDVEEHENAD